VNEYSQSSVPSIWAVGDVTNRLNLTPVALHEATCFSVSPFLYLLYALISVPLFSTCTLHLVT